MDNTAEKDPQERILMLLETNPHSAMALAVEQYTSLIWHVAERYLENPEDIKECANDTFMEFYTNREHFDSSRGSLAAFLVTITRNLAVSRYRRNNVHSTLELDEEIPGDIGQIDNLYRKLDLEKAMAALKPEDMDIIRMKYYDGMTIQEIADSLGLPYETVKKRHQRSLGRMRLVLIAALTLLLALLLAACAYIAMRYFGIVPGFGIVSEPNLPIYMLEDKVTVTNDVGEYVLRDAFVVDSELIVRGSVHFHSEDTSTWRPGNPEGMPEVAVLQTGEDMHICLAGYYVEFPQDIEFEISAQDIGMPSDGEGRWNMSLDWAGVDFPLAFRLSGAEDFQGYDYWMGEYGGMLVIPRLEEGRLLVDVYALNRKDAEHYPADKCEVRLESLRAVAEDGRVLEGKQGSTMYGYFVTWDFGEALPGKYVLQVPELMLVFPYEEEISIPVNLETCEWEDAEYEIPGGCVSVVYCEYQDIPDGEIIPHTGEVKQEGFSYWKVGLRYRMDEASDGELGQPQMLYFYGSCPAGENAAEFFMKERNQENGTEDGYQERLVCIRDGSAAISRYELLPNHEVIVPWRCNLSIPVTVEADR